MSQAHVDSRNALHAAAEWLLAGPQYVRTGTIRLSVVDDGVATLDGRATVGADGLVLSGDEPVARVPWSGTIAAMARAANLQPSVPQDLYRDHAKLGVDDPLSVDPSQVRSLLDWFRRGHGGLLAFAPTEVPVLWPEHFDLAISVAEVNYGLSLGDGYHPTPYAYVGPWQPPVGDFWNAPFGAVRPASQLPDATAIADFFATGARRASAGNPD